MTKLLFQLLDQERLQEAEQGTPFSCSGCSGLIKFSLLSTEKAVAAGLLDPQPVPNPELDNLLELMREFPMIQAVPDPDLPRLVSRFRRIVVGAGKSLIEKGAPSHSLYVVLSGNLVVSDDSLVIATLSPGDICGEMSYLAGDVASANVTAVSEAEIVVISGDDFSQLLDRIPGLQLYMAQVLAHRLSRANTVRFNTFDACMSGRISEMPPAELFQIFHMNKKTGVLTLAFASGKAKVSFREGCVINAQYGDKSNESAIFAMLGERDGRYAFTSGLSPEEMRAAEIGDFMMLLMEGIKRVDEAEEKDPVSPVPEKGEGKGFP